MPVDKKVKGTVTKVEEGGVMLILASPISDGDQIDGFIKKDKIPPGTVYSIGQIIDALVSEHDKRRHRILLVPVLLEKPIGYR